MSLGSFLGSAGLTTIGAQQISEAAMRGLDLQRQRETMNRARRQEDEDRVAEEQYANTVAGIAPPGMGEIPGQLPTIKAPPAPVAPAVTATQPPAAGVAPPIAAPPPAAGVAMPGTAGVPDYVTAGTGAATGAPAAIPAGPALTQRDINTVNQWVKSGDAQNYFTAHPDQYAAYLKDKPGWIKNNLVRGGPADLYSAPDQVAAANQRIADATKQATEWYSHEFIGSVSGGISDWQTNNRIASLQQQAARPNPFTPGSRNYDNFEKQRGVLRQQVTDLQRNRETPEQRAVNYYPETRETVAAQRKAIAAQTNLRKSLDASLKGLTPTAATAVGDAQIAAAPEMTTAPKAATDVVPTSSAPMIASAATLVGQNKGPSEAYMANPEAIVPDTKRALATRDLLVAKMRNMTKARIPGSGPAFMELAGKLNEIDNGIAHKQGMQAIMETTTLGDPRRLASVLGYYTGIPINIQPRSDGTYNIINGQTGKIVSEGLTQDELVFKSRALFDEAWLEKQREIAAAAAAEGRKNQFEIDKITAQGQIDFGLQNLKDSNSLVQALAVEQAKTLGAIDLEAFKRSHPELDIKPTSDGGAFIRTPDGQALYYNPAGQSVTIGDKTVTLRGTQPVYQGGAGGTSPGGTFPAGRQ